MSRGIFISVAAVFAAFMLHGAVMHAEEFRKVMEFRIWDFEDMPAGTTPPEWKPETMEGISSSVCRVMEDRAGGNRVLVLSGADKSRVRSECWTGELVFLNGTLEARMRPEPGHPSGAGLMWRIRDSKNYYSVRYALSDKRFVLYAVKDGIERELADAVYSTLDTSGWFMIKILHQGEKISCLLNGKELLSVSDSTHPEAGGIGVWTEPGAWAAFDNIIAKLVFPALDQAKQQI